MSKLEAILFDMDGTLLDSESFAAGVWKQAANELGYELTKETFDLMIGTSVSRCNEILLERLGSDLNIDQLRKRKTEMEYESLELTTIPLKPGAKEILEYFNADLPIGLATSTDRKRTTARLENTSLGHFFDETVCGDEVVEGKPHPEIYFTVAEKLGVEINNCIIVEDSPTGVEAGVRSGARTIWIKDIVDISKDLEDGVWKRCKDLHEVLEILSESLKKI